MSGEGASALSDIVAVSRETAERLEAYVALLRRWQNAENLVSPATLPDVWRRHIADSAQLVALFPDAHWWLDIGSGAGLPGLVVAIVAGGRGETQVHLVESNRRKSAFLRRAIAVTEAGAVVHEGRAEEVLRDWRAPVDRVIARAVAPLNDLLRLASPVMAAGAAAAFHKGRDFGSEVEGATQSWAFDLVVHDSRVGEGGVILDISHLRRSTEQDPRRP